MLDPALPQKTRRQPTRQTEASAEQPPNTLGPDESESEQSESDQSEPEQSESHDSDQCEPQQSQSSQSAADQSEHSGAEESDADDQCSQHGRVGETKQRTLHPIQSELQASAQLQPTRQLRRLRRQTEHTAVGQEPSPTGPVMLEAKSTRVKTQLALHEQGQRQSRRHQKAAQAAKAAQRKPSPAVQLVSAFQSSNLTSQQQAYMQQMGLASKGPADTIGDGNCQFRALSQQQAVQDSSKGTIWAMNHSVEAQAQHASLRLTAAAELRENEILQNMIVPDHVDQVLRGGHANSAAYNQALGCRPTSALPYAMADKLEQLAAEGQSYMACLAYIACVHLLLIVILSLSSRKAA